MSKVASLVKRWPDLAGVSVHFKKLKISGAVMYCA